MNAEEILVDTRFNIAHRPEEPTSKRTRCGRLFVLTVYTQQVAWDGRTPCFVCFGEARKVAEG